MSRFFFFFELFKFGYFFFLFFLNDKKNKTSYVMVFELTRRLT